MEFLKLLTEKTTFNKNIKKGILFNFVSILASASVYIISKSVQQTMQTELFCFYWYFAGTIIMEIYNIYRARINPFKILYAHKEELLPYLFIESLIALTFFNAIRLIDPSVVSFLNLSQTLFVLFFGITLLKEKPGFFEIVGGVLAIIGIALTSLKSGFSINNAVLIIISSSLLQAFNVTFASKYVRKHSAFSILFIRTIFLSILFFLVTSAMGQLRLSNTSETISLALGGLLGPFINMLFFYGAIKYLEMSSVVLLRTSTPLFVLLGSLIFFDYLPTNQQLVGYFILFCGTNLIIFGKYKGIGKRIKETIVELEHYFHHLGHR